jgi:DNA-binding CsgD family transcriptional regulator
LLGILSNQSTAAGIIRVSESIAQRSDQSEKPMTVSPDNMLQKLSAIQALPVSIAVLDSRGTIVGVNGRWEQFGRRNALRLPRAGVGLNYLDYCNAPGSSRLLRDLRALLRGRLDLLTLIYPCHSPTKKRWFVLSGVPLSLGAPSGVALVHTDLTGILPDAVTSGERSSKRSRDEIVRLDLDVIGASVERAISEGLTSQLTDMLTDRGTVAPSQTAKGNTGQIVGHSGLSRRQLEVLRLLGEGKTNKEIARSLAARLTPSLHVSAILRQLRFKNRTEAAVLHLAICGRELAAADRQT